jgi:hypothetical protein
MASFIRRGILAVFFATALFSTSCEKHPLGQLPEVQREQPDPAKLWSNAEEQEQHSEEHSTSETPAEVPHEAR